VYSDPSIGLIAGAKKGNYLVDCSTVSPDTSKTLHERCLKEGVHFHDAPVAGAEPAAITGKIV
jgi:3-hydroxyisobutyrate dehydrogenase-like beta-hydroxyacid dehydrogenase